MLAGQWVVDTVPDAYWQKLALLVYEVRRDAEGDALEVGEVEEAELWLTPYPMFEPRKVRARPTHSPWAAGLVGWAPDGSAVLVQTYPRESSPWEDQSADLWLAPTDGGEWRKLAEDCAGAAVSQPWPYVP